MAAGGFVDGVRGIRAIFGIPYLIIIGLSIRLMVINSSQQFDLFMLCRVFYLLSAGGQSV